MQQSRKTEFGFVMKALAALGIVVLLTMTLISAEVYLTNGKMVASTEIENNCAACSEVPGVFKLADRKDKKTDELIRVLDHPWHATGVDLKGPPLQFPPHQTPGFTNVVDY